MIVLDRLTEAVCLEDVEDRYVDSYINANPGMFSTDALEDHTIVDQPGNDVDTLAGAAYEGDELEIPDEDGFTPTAYDSYAAMAHPGIDDDDVPETSPLYEDEADEDSGLTDEELAMAATLDDVLEMQWQKGANKYFWETAPEPNSVSESGDSLKDELKDRPGEEVQTEGRLTKKLKDNMVASLKSSQKSAEEHKQKKKELGYGGGIGYSLGRTTRALASPVVNFGKGMWKGLKGESGMLTPEEMQEAARAFAPEEYENFFEMEAGLTARETISEADEELARHEAYMQPVTFDQIAEQNVNVKPEVPYDMKHKGGKPGEIPDSKHMN